MTILPKPYFAFALVSFSLIASTAVGDQKTDDRDFDAVYQEFVDAFRATTDPGTRLELVKKTTREIKTLISNETSASDLKKLLPRLVAVRFLDLDESFATIIDDHPEDSIRALALLCFAKHCGNNGRDELSKRTLAFLAKKYGKLPHDDSTFAKAAEDAFYFLTNLTVGKKSPEIAGTDADDVVFRLQDYQGKVVMLRFWGDWCPACRAMFDYERQIVNRYKNRPFALIGVNSDSLERLKAAQDRSNLTWRTIWDGGTTHGPISLVYRVKQWPTIIVIDAEGIIRYRSEGLAKPQLNEVLARCVREAQTSLEVASNLE